MKRYKESVFDNVAVSPILFAGKADVFRPIAVSVIAVWDFIRTFASYRLYPCLCFWTN